MVKSVVGGPDGSIQVTNCAFMDGNASGINFAFTHNINGCLFSNVFMAIEFYEGYMTGSLDLREFNRDKCCQCHRLSGRAHQPRCPSIHDKQ